MRLFKVLQAGLQNPFLKVISMTKINHKNNPLT